MSNKNSRSKLDPELDFEPELETVPDQEPGKKLKPSKSKAKNRTVTRTTNTDVDSNPVSFSSDQFLRFIREQREAGRRKETRSVRELRKKMAAEKVKNLLEHQVAMLRLTRQMNKLLGDLRLCKEEIEMDNDNSDNWSSSSASASFVPPGQSSTSTSIKNSNPFSFKSRLNSKEKEKYRDRHRDRELTEVKVKLSKKMKEKNEYVIFSGGPKGLEYKSIEKSDTGTFRMEIDVSNYDPEDLHISTEDHKTMQVKASRLGIRKTLKLVSPHGVDIDDVIIHYPKRGVLLLEAP